MYGPVEAEPYAWPFDGAFDVAHTAVVCIDWQVDFCGAGGYVDAMGYDLKLTRAGLEPTARVLAAVRPLGMMVVHTREGISRTWPTARPTSCGGLGASAPASATPDPAGASWCGASRVGTSFPRLPPSPAR